MYTYIPISPPSEFIILNYIIDHIRNPEKKPS